jgi:hypothetical protein
MKNLSLVILLMTLMLSAVGQESQRTYASARQNISVVMFEKLDDLITKDLSRSSVPMAMIRNTVDNAVDIFSNCIIDALESDQSSIAADILTLLEEGKSGGEIRQEFKNIGGQNRRDAYKTTMRQHSLYCIGVVNAQLGTNIR